MILKNKLVDQVGPKEFFMKKIKLVSILLIVMLVLTVALTACNNTKTLTLSVRWEKDENTVYSIGLQDLTKATNEVVFDEKIFTRDTVTTPTDYNRVRPSAVNGTLTTTLTINSDGTATYSTVQIVTDTYNATDNNYFAVASSLYDQLTAEEKVMLDATVTDNTTIAFTSQTTTSVTFLNDTTQKPVSSTKTIQGYYLGTNGKTEVNNVTYATTYADGKATVTKDGAELHQLEVASNVVDALQIPLVVRSLDQSKTTTDGKYVAPAVTVYDCVANKTTALTLAVYRDMAVLLNLEPEYKYAVASVVTVAVGGTYIYTFTSNPNDTYSTDVGDINTNKQVRFQSEYYTYEITSYDGIVEDLKYKVASEKQ